MEHKAGDLILNKYRIEAKVGQGAFGVVYRVTHLRLNALRAIKLLRRDTPGIGSQDFKMIRERFDFEARLGAQLDHPNVIKVYDFEEAAGELYLVMEYASGGSLSDRLERMGTLNLDDAVQLGLDVCAGLTAIYDRMQIVHRDLKPSNILFGEAGVAKICDLGLAQVRGDRESRRSLLGSLAGAHPGTPLYMSPEQGSSKDYLLPTSDVFSLGCVLFEALTGVPYKEVYGTDLRTHRSSLPEWLEVTLIRALAETPGRMPTDDSDQNKRYRNAERLRRDLQFGWEGELVHRSKEIARLDAQARVLIRAGSWVGVETIISAMTALGKIGQEAAGELQGELDTARRVVEERARAEKERQQKLIAAQKAFTKALKEEDFSVAQQSLEQARRLGIPEHEAQKMQLAFRQSQQAAAKRIRRVEQLEQDVNRALGRSNWSQAEALLAQMGALGAEGQAAEASLRLRLQQAKEDTHHRSQEIVKIRQEAGSRIEEADWAGAEQLIGELMALGAAGMAMAEELKSRMSRARQQVELHQRELDRCIRDFEEALQKENWATAKGGIEKARNLGMHEEKVMEMGAALEQALSQSRKSWLQKGEDALAGKNWRVARQAVSKLMKLGAEEAALALQSRLETVKSESRPRLTLKEEDFRRIARWTIAFAGILLLVGIVVLAAIWLPRVWPPSYSWSLRGGNQTATVESGLPKPTSTLMMDPSANLVPETQITSSPLSTQVDKTGLPSEPFIPTPMPFSPARLGTPVPQPENPISPQNVADVTTLAYWGSGTINQLAISPNGKQLAVASPIGIHLYDADTLDIIRFIDPGAGVLSVAFSPDGESLAAGLADNTVKLLSVPDGSILKLLRGHIGPVTGVAFSPDGENLASGSKDETVRIWRIQDGTMQQKMEGNTGEITSVAYSPDGEVVGAGSGVVQLWQAWDGSLIKTLRGLPRVTSLAFSPDGKTLASGSNNGDIGIWGVSDGSLLRTLEGHTSLVSSVAFAPNGERLASGSWDNTIRIWQASDGALTQTLEGHTTAVTSLVYVPAGESLISGSRDSNIRQWSTSDGTSTKSIRESPEFFTPGNFPSITFSPDWQTLAYASGSENVELGRISDGRIEITRLIHPENIYGIVYSFFGNVLATGSQEALYLWKTSDDSLWQTIERDAMSYALSPDGQILASGYRDGVIRLTQLSDGALLNEWNGYPQDVHELAFSPDGELLASASQGELSVRLWNTLDGSLLHNLGGLTGDVSVFGFSQDGKVIASGTESGLLYQWDVRDGTQLFQLEGHSDNVNSIAFSPDGRILASGSEDGTVRLWNTKDGAIQRVLRVHTGPVIYVSFSPDGNYLASGSTDDTIRLWGAPPGIYDQEPINQTSSPAALSAEQASITPSRGYEVYQVQSGDTLLEIAEKFSVSLEELKHLNQTKDDLISPGTVLQIPPTPEKIPTDTQALSSTPEVTPTPLLAQIVDEFGVPMVLVPEGLFLMGNDLDESASPAHWVTLSAYYIDIHEVTNDEYAECVDAGYCNAPAYYSSSPLLGNYYKKSGFPVKNILWKDAKKFCEWRGARLPTEAEWEKAARGTDGRTYPWGEDINCNYANYSPESGSCVSTATQVGTYPLGASPYGALDMAGNVGEWVGDWYGEDYYENSSFDNPPGPVTGWYRIIRGGSHTSDELQVQSSSRSRVDPKFITAGFRCARSP